jgi:hypothetical protein
LPRIGDRRGNAYVGAEVGLMAKLRVTWSTVGIAAMLAALLAILIAAAWFASRAWTTISGPPMPTAGYVAMTLGIVFSLVVGCGLMALLFYSNRYGYDDQFKPGNDDPK